MTGTVLLIVSLLFLAASIESLLENWRDLRRALRGLAKEMSPAATLDQRR